MTDEPNQPGDAPSPLRAWASKHGLMAVICTALLAPLCVDPLPIQDLPLHEQIVSLLLHGTEWSGQAERLAVDASPRPYAVVHFLWTALSWVFGIGFASRLLLTYALVGGFVSGVALVRRLDPRKRTRALLVGLLVFSEFYYVGFVPLLLALPTGFWLLARRMPKPEGGAPKTEVADAVLLLVSFLCHPVGGFLFGLVLIPVCARSEKPVRALGRLVLIGLPCVLWTVAIALFAESRPLSPDLPAAWVNPLKPLASLVFTPTASYGWWLFWPLGGAARALAILSIVAWGVAAAALWPRGEPVAHERTQGLGISLLVLLAFLFAFPDAWRNGSVLSVRALLLFFPLLLAWLPARAEDRRTTLLTAVAVFLSIAVALAAHVIVAREARPLDALLERLEPKENVLPPMPMKNYLRSVRGQVLNVDPVRYSGAVRGRLVNSPHMHAVIRHHARAGGLGPEGGLYHSNSAVRVTKPLPHDPDPRVYRYLLLKRGALPMPPRGFVELDLPDPDWVVYERTPR